MITNNYPLSKVGWSDRASYWCPKKNKWRRVKTASNVHFDSNQLVILSYNVWFDNRKQKERMAEIGRIIAASNPDLIALQEMTPTLCKLLFSQEWVSIILSNRLSLLLNFKL